MDNAGLVREAGASTSALDERVHRTEFGVQVIARDIDAGLDHLSSYENRRTFSTGAKQILQFRLL